jgi:hypothetical protein
MYSFIAGVVVANLLAAVASSLPRHLPAPLMQTYYLLLLPLYPAICLPTGINWARNSVLRNSFELARTSEHAPPSPPDKRPVASALNSPKNYRLLLKTTHHKTTAP